MSFTTRASLYDPALPGPADPPFRVGAEPGAITARWPVGPVDPKGWQPQAELRLTYDTHASEKNRYTAALVALYCNGDGATIYAVGAAPILVYLRPGARFRRGQLERSYQRAVTVLRERYVHDPRVREYFDPASRVFTDLECFGIGFHIRNPAADNPARRWELHREANAAEGAPASVLAHGIAFPDGTAAMRWTGSPALTASLDSAIHAEILDGHPGCRVVWIDPAPPSTGRDTTRVALRATLDDGTQTWVICACPADVLGNALQEADELKWQCNRYSGDVIVIDAVEGFAAGCCTWSRYSQQPDPANPHGSEYAQARAEHWGCQHTLFGGSTDDWTDETDLHMGRALGTITEWRLESLDWGAAVVRTTDEPDVVAVWIFRDSEQSGLPDTHGDGQHVLVEAAPYPSIEDAKTAATAMIVDLLCGQHPTGAATT
ncbi:hypothetical protein [Nocardia niwae]|uniref:hypothetical protein n=1 Tax=Nocardia niwae TaxID=626084 RepID=UPI0033EFEEB3